MSAEPTLVEIFRLAIESRLLDLHVALPCRVEVYNPALQTADVLPMVRRAISDSSGNTQHEELPILPNVPVLFPRGGPFSITWDLAVGDTVLVVFASSAIGKWRESGDIANPGDLRRHDLSHGIAIPGVAPAAEVLPFDVSGNPLITAPILKVDGAVEIGNPLIPVHEPVSIASLVEARLFELADAIKTSGTTAGDGGAAFKAAILAALLSAGWTGSNTPPTTAASNLNAEP